MDRSTFCKMLVICKRKSGKSTSELCYDMRVLPTSITRIEKAQTNFQMDRCLSYLNLVGYHIELSGNEIEYVIRSESDIVEYIKNELDGRSRSKVSIDLGCDRSYLRHIEQGTHGITIDKFLKFNEIVGCDLYLIKNEP